MSASLITFLLFLASVSLLLWSPEATVPQGLLLLVWSALGFASGIALLFSLFTLWWPPVQGWAVFWSAASLLALFVVMVAKTKPRDWVD